MKRFILAVVFFSISFVAVSLPAQAVASTVLINEIKLGGAVSGELTEYVKLYNTTHEPLDLTGWVLEYAKPSAHLPDCNVPSWKVSDNSSATSEVGLSGQLSAKSEAQFAVSLNDNVGGSLRLRQDSLVHDLVGWGSTQSNSPCFKGKPAPVPLSTQFLTRKTTTQDQLVDTGHNLNDFQVSLLDSCLNLSGLQEDLPAGYEITAGGDCTLISLPVAQCQGIEISEIVPNPAGSDAGTEFIELHNTTSQPIDLTDCVLRVGSAQKILQGYIQPGYQAFYGLTLPNSADGTVEFITPTTKQVVQYPAHLADDTAWMSLQGVWQLTLSATPGAENQLILPELEAVVSEAESAACPEGKYRNPETNRCKNLETAEATLAACDPGEERNSETNRCRKIAGAVSVLAPCGVGEERNTETNRCRKVAATSSSPTPCQPGYERNPATNRCRKATGAGSGTATGTLSQPAAINPVRLNFWIIIVVTLMAVGYGLYEYRNDIKNFIVRLRDKSGGSRPSG